MGSTLGQVPPTPVQPIVAPSAPRFGKFRTSRLLLKESWAVLKKDKEIAIFPILTAIVGIGVFVLFALGVFFFSYGGDINAVSSEINGSSSTTNGDVFLPVFFLYYLVIFFITTFFQAGIVTIVHGRLNGQDLSFRDGMRNASRHVGKIFIWSLLAATVGVVMNLIAERSKWLGKLIVWLAGTAWSIATFFIVPTLILEELSLKESIKKSVFVFKKTWGETVIIAVSVGLYFGLLAFLGILVFCATLFSFNKFIIIASFGLLLIFFIALAIISSSLDAIFNVALYEYANSGKVPEGFSPELIQNVIQKK